MKKSQVIRFPMMSPADVSGLKRLLDEGTVAAGQIVAVLAKTEGNGCVNDFTRGYSTFAFQVLLSEVLGISREEVARRVAFVMSGGTEGVLSPHATVFAWQDEPGRPSGRKRLAVGANHTRDFKPEEIGRMEQVEEVANGVREAMRMTDIDSVDDIHFVQIKCPLLTSERMEDAGKRGQSLATRDTYESMGYSRGASALGIALALGEVEQKQLSNEVIHHDWNLYSRVASTSAGVELMNCEIILMGNSAKWGGDLVIGHGVMKDAIDGAAVREALRSVGIGLTDGEVDAAERDRVINAVAKAEADPGSYIRGRRHTMLNDSDINNTRHARAVVGAVLASIVGDPMVYVSGGAEHQGPAGGGPVAVIARAR
jgi:cyanuric acid amidohydrolase